MDSVGGAGSSVNGALSNVDATSKTHLSSHGVSYGTDGDALEAAV